MRRSSVRLATLAGALVMAGPVPGCAKPAAKHVVAPGRRQSIPTPRVPGTADGAPATIIIGGVNAVRVTPLRMIAAGTAKCAADLAVAGRAAQRLVLIGKGETEALSCDGIVAFGQVPAPAGTARIAFLYRGHSPNAESLTPVFLARGTGAWMLDDALGQAVGEHGELDTIPKIRIYLARHGNPR